MTQFENVLETILEEYTRRDSEGEFDTWEETDAFVKEKAEVLLAYAKEEPVSEELEEAAKNHAYSCHTSKATGERIAACIYDFKAGAQWQKTKDESTTEDLGDYISELSKQFPDVSFAKLSRIAVRVAKWQKENLWKAADGDDLPEYEREVVVFTQNFPDDAGMMRVAIGHRPNPDGFDGKSIATGKVEHYTPKTYDKGGWNIPDIVYWLDVELPKEIEL